MSACGLDCRTCELRLFPENQAAQEKILGWFHREKWLGETEGVPEVIARKMYCKGCADTDVFWGGDCEVAPCCKKAKKLSHCAECRDFPCDKYNKWLASAPPSQADKYQQACEYLKSIKTGK